MISSSNTSNPNPTNSDFSSTSDFSHPGEKNARDRMVAGGFQWVEDVRGNLCASHSTLTRSLLFSTLVILNCSGRRVLSARKDNLPKYFFSI